LFKKFVKYIHKEKKTVSKLAYVMIIVGLILAVPQVYEIYATKDATGVSIITWAGWIVSGFFWIIYGIAIRQAPIVISAFLKIILNGMIVYGIILYG